MRRSKDFSLFIISDVPYLLPFGQGIADLRRGIQVNDAGAFLWNLLDRERTEEEMLSLYAAHYEISDPGLPQLKSDLKEFLHTLDSFGMLERPDHISHSDSLKSANIPASNEWNQAGIPISGSHTQHRNGTDIPVPAVRDDAVRRYLSIGGLTLLLCGPNEAFSRDFDAFEIFPNPSHPPAGEPMAENIIPVDQVVTVTEQTPEPRPYGKTLLENRELSVLEDDSQYTFYFPAAVGIREARLTKDGHHARYYCIPPYTNVFRKDLFHAIRLSFLYLAQLHNMVVLHSASLLYRDRAWLFSGHSGAGKSTHTNLWKELYHAPLVNGDLNLLSMNNGCPMVHGMPWCGTSGICDTHSYPLGGILFVRKSLQNRTAALDASHAQLFVAQRLISPNWTEALLRKNLRLVAEIAPHILICRLYCTRDPEAAATARQAIDNYLALLPAAGSSP